MKQGCRLGMVMAALAALAGAAGAQIESHCPPPEMPPVLFPTWVSLLPPLESQQVSAPLVQADARPAKDSRRNARALADLDKEPGDAIRLAESGRHKEAAAAGNALLKLPRARYGDFTWDYLANATAWAYVQTGDLKAAAGAHNAAAARTNDPAVTFYHRIAANALNDTKKPPQEMKDPATYTTEVREHLVERVKGFQQSTALARNTRAAASRLRHLESAYADVRAVVAADPDIGKNLIDTAFREAADSLVTDTIPPLLEEARQIRTRLVAAYAQMIPERKFGDWNRDVKTLWNRVQHIKRLCRMHDYLRRMNLASRGDAARLFREAHELLFANKPGTVWQELGHIRLVNNIAQLDLRPRLPWQETVITPWGVPSSGRVATSNSGWKQMDTMDGKMQTMDGKMQTMDGKMQTMDGKMTPMNGKMTPMNGKMQRMDGKMQGM